MFPPSFSPFNDNRPQPHKTVVLFLNHSSQISGAEVSLHALLRALRQKHPEIETIVALPDQGRFLQTLREEKFEVVTAPLRRVRRPRGLIEGAALALDVLRTAPSVCRIIDRTGAQIVHSNSTTAHLVGSMAAKKSSIPAIWHCRDLVSLGKIAPQLAARSERVLAISECVSAQLQKDGVPVEKIRVVFNGLDTDFWRRKPSILRGTLGIPEDAFLFGLIGQLVPWKNHARFIEAAAKLAADDRAQNARFCIIGSDLWGEQESYGRELRALVEQHGLSDRFIFIPNQSDAVDAISALDCLVHPAENEPFGRVIMEAMALEIPVVAINRNGPREIITHGRDGLLVDPGAPDGLEHAMRDILRSPELRQNIARTARLTIESRFDGAIHAAQIRAIYRELV